VIIRGVVKIKLLYLLKLKVMNLSIKELNDLYYCVGRVRMDEGVKFMSNKELDRLSDRIWDEIVKINNEAEVGDQN